MVRFRVVALVSIIATSAMIPSALSVHVWNFGETEIQGLTLIDAATGADLQPVNDGDVIELAATPPNLTIRAETGGLINSVRFIFDDRTISNKLHYVDKNRPFALAGDDGQQNYIPVEALSTIGLHTISASAVFQRLGFDVVGDTKNITLHVIHSVLGQTSDEAYTSNHDERKSLSTRRNVQETGHVTGFSFVDAKAKSNLFALADGDDIDISALGTDFTIQAKTSAGQIWSVVFDFDGIDQIVIDNTSPHTATDKFSTTLPLLALDGKHTVSAQAFPNINGWGAGTEKLTVDFRISGSTADLCTFDAPDVLESTVSTDVAKYEYSVAGTLNGELKRWHKITIGFRGPTRCERTNPNPFTFYRLEVTFTHPDSGTTHEVPGYYAADGDAANSGAVSGNVWLVHFAPGLVGTWTWAASFQRGTNVAQNGGGVAAGFFDGKTGSFDVMETDKTGRDHRGKGMLEYVGAHHLRFAGSGEWFLKAGADSPENFLAYEDFDNTANWKELRKSWSPHAQDYIKGDPTWAGGRGTEIIGAINYLAEQRMNVFSFLTMNLEGDDRNVFPYISQVPGDDRLRMDVSKLAQWEVVFEHADHIGMYLHFKTQETENDHLLDGGELGLERKLYYRELIARFGHHLALNWNIGEENTNTPEQQIAFTEYFKALDPYKHHVVMHTGIPRKDELYTPLLGVPTFDGPSMQSDREDVFNDTLKWVTESAKTDQKWVVANDEQGPATEGVVPDDDDPGHYVVRKEVLWGNLMAGGAGVEYYFGYIFPNSDLTCEDFRSRENMWAQSRYALEFFQDNNIPFWNMSNDNSLVADDAWCLADPDYQVVVVYVHDGTTTIDLPSEGGVGYSVKWYDPREGGALQNGSVELVHSGRPVSLGTPPSDDDEDEEDDDGEEGEGEEKDDQKQDWVIVLRPVHPDIIEIIDPIGKTAFTGEDYPKPASMDSYSVGDKCYCDTNFDHSIGTVSVQTPLGQLSVEEVCNLIGDGPGRQGRPQYNDVQCGNGPASVGPEAESSCPGRVDIGSEGCWQIGPTWNFDGITRPLGEAGGRRAVRTGEPIFFNDGQPLPAGTYKIAYVDGCMKYHDTNHGWTVNGGLWAYAWWLVREDPPNKGRLGNVKLPGTEGFTASGGAYVSFLDCVAANNELDPLIVELETEGPLGIWLADYRYDDNIEGFNGRNPTWKLTLLAAR